MNPLGALTALPLEAVGALRLLARLSEQLDEIAASTRALPEIAEAIQQVAADTSALGRVERHTAALPSVDEQLREVAGATDVLPTMLERMSAIERAMPTLVMVQEHLARLPETMDTLGAGLNDLSALMERLLGSLQELDRNVGVLRSSIQPLARIAERMPGRRPARPD